MQEGCSDRSLTGLFPGWVSEPRAAEQSWVSQQGSALKLGLNRQLMVPGRCGAEPSEEALAAVTAVSWAACPMEGGLMGEALLPAAALIPVVIKGKNYTRL